MNQDKNQNQGQNKPGQSGNFDTDSDIRRDDDKNRQGQQSQSNPMKKDQQGGWSDERQQGSGQNQQGQRDPAQRDRDQT